jgi:NADH-quinone oxidoreductase subunit L
MEGPTPVSAYLHSTTMVKAGVFAAIVLAPILYAANAMMFLFAIGMLTALFGMFNAMRERHIKKILAYSTVQELGLMFMAVSSNALLAAVYFFFAQSFYKALLFFGSGVVMKANDDKEDIEDLSGMKKNRIVYITTLFGVLALAGFIPFDGFFANVGIAAVFSMNLVVYAVISLISMGTSFYIFRWLIVQNKKTVNPRALLNYNSVPGSMSYSMLVLAVITVLAGVAFLLLPGLLSNANLVTSGKGVSLGIPDMAIETVLVAAGALLGYFVYRKRKVVETKKKAGSAPARSYEFVYTAGIFNNAYAKVAAFVEVVAGGASRLDVKLNDAFDDLGNIALGSGNRMRKLANGGINTYVLIFVAGLLIIVAAALVIS